MRVLSFALACAALALMATLATPPARSRACYNEVVDATEMWVGSLRAAERQMAVGRADTAFTRSSAVRLRARRPGAVVGTGMMGEDIVVPRDPAVLADMVNRASRIGYVAAVRLRGMVNWERGRLDRRASEAARSTVVNAAIRYFATLPEGESVMRRQVTAEAKLTLDPNDAAAKAELRALHTSDLMVDAWGYAMLARVTTDEAIRAEATARCTTRAGAGARRVCAPLSASRGAPAR